MGSKTFLKSFIIVAIVVLLIAVIVKRGPLKGTQHAPYRQYVKRVIDGDTIVLTNNQRVRYIGIDTPEISHPHKGVEWLGAEAKDFNKKLVEHKWVRLEFDIELRDKYGRLLAYVYVDDKFVNAELVKQGYAKVYTFPPNVKYVDLFLELQKEARGHTRGLWGGR